MKIVNLNPELLTVGWTVNHLPPAVKPVIPGLTASFFVKATFRLRPGEAPVPWEKRPDQPSGDRPMGGVAARGIGYASDFVPYKPHGEFALVGTAIAPGPGLRAFPVRARVGAVTKSIDVIGDRAWQTSLLGAAPGPPAVVERVPLDYAHAWGGPGVPSNPLGCGHEGDRLPNLELPNAHVLTRAARAQPAGFAPIPPGWELRREKLGTYDQAWLRERWPWMPDDFDWTFFNAAPPTQWANGYWRGDEDFEFDHLHASHPVYRGRLPGLRARGFFTPTVEGEERFVEVPLDLDTLWFDLDQEKLVLVWRGRAAVSSLKLKDIAHLLILVEPLDAPPGDYRALLATAVAPPAPAPSADNEETDARRAAAEAQLAGAKAQMAQARQQAAAMVEAAEGRQAGFAGKLGLTPQPLSFAESLAEFETRLGQLKTTSGVSAEQVASLEETLTGLRAMGDPEKHLAARQAAIEARAGGTRPPAPSVPRDPEALATARQNGFAGADLHGADFSGLDLSGVTFSGAILAGANFAGTNLSRAKLDRCDLSGANLTRANLEGADLSGADLHGAVVVEAVWAGACVRRAKLAELDFGAANLRGVHGDSADFTKARLGGANFAGANLPRGGFTEALVERADFSKARLPRAEFGGVRAAGADFRDAELGGWRAGRGADFTGAHFQRVSAPKSIWKGAVCDGANFQQAALVRAQFSEARLRGAVLDRCDLRHATFEDAVLLDAELTHANLLRALFDRADLTRARLDGSNLFEAGLWNATLAHATWAGANIKHTRLAR